MLINRLGHRSRAVVASGRTHFARARALGRACIAEMLETRQFLTINASVVAGGTLDINPISSIFATSNYTILAVGLTSVPGVAHGTIARLDNTVETAWGTTGSGNDFGPGNVSPNTQNRIYAGQGLRYHNNGTGTGTSESIPITIRDSTGFNAYSDTLVISIVSPVGAPKITTDVVGLTSVAIGQTATLSVTASGNAPLTYQWYIGLSPNTSTPIGGATSATYTTPAQTTIGQHFYWVQVKNGVGVANSQTATVKAGHPPVVNAGGPYGVAEAGSVTLNGSATDPDNGLYLVYNWDFDGDGIYGEANTAYGNEQGKNAVFQAGDSDGPGSRTISLQAQNDNGVNGYANATVNFTNTAPKATFAGNATGTVSFTGQVDSALDLSSMKYSYDFDDNGTFEVSNVANASWAVPAAYTAAYLAGTPVRGRITDKDGASTDYVANVHGRAILVTNLLDEVNSAATYAISAGTSLREALALAEATSGDDAIVFDPALTAGGDASIKLNLVGNTATGNSALGVTGTVFISGPSGNNGILLDGQGNNVDLRAFYVAPTGNLTLENLTFRDFASRTTVAGAIAQGGAIYNGGSLTVRRSSFVRDTAIANASGTGAYGGGIYATNASTVIENATFIDGGAVGGSGNAPALGGGIFLRNGSLTLSYSTLSNLKATDGRGVFLMGDGSGVAAANAVLRNDILGQSDSSLRDFDAAIVNGGVAPISSGTNNLIRSSLNFGGTASSADPRLALAADNGGPVTTLMINTDSPAINAGIAIAGITTDARGITRAQGNAADIGAVERAATPITLLNVTYDFQTRQALTMNFTGEAEISLARANVTIQNLTTGATITAPGTISFNASGTQATLVMTNLLPDGHYHVSFVGVGSTTTIDFTVLAGDANHDAKVDFSDLLVLAKNYGQSPRTNSTGDTNYDGIVDFTDLLRLAKNYNVTVPAAAAPAIVTDAAARLTRRRTASDVIA